MFYLVASYKPYIFKVELLQRLDNPDLPLLSYTLASREGGSFKEKELKCLSNILNEIREHSLKMASSLNPQYKENEDMWAPPFSNDVA